MMTSSSEQFNSIVLWNILGKAVTIAMIPWMVWVSLTIIRIQSDVAVMTAQVGDLPTEVRLLRDRIIRIESQVSNMP